MNHILKQRDDLIKSRFESLGLEYSADLPIHVLLEPNRNSYFYITAEESHYLFTCDTSVPGVSKKSQLNVLPVNEQEVERLIEIAKMQRPIDV